eukprot:CAMPEP_0203854400 /NCGR_PEP_ID=MMETSP0359-20131031/9077_1 /ASSEMBLY_ACC=CAM_ASM_000338 /TAXON_ID=268821 /ORGANISM="Scrippsiella Hangoei, Strain SHTV-5" /LENGTH=285 /DNA_ID=CAMNT_0050770871 /DNA_START=202 /DNA_END=1055 /DNA_ORIENTATION=-
MRDPRPLWWPLAQSIVYEAPDGVGVVVVVQDGARVRQDLIQHLTPCRGFFREGDLLGRIGHEGARESRRARHGVLLELEARTLRPQDACSELLQLLRVGVCPELQRSTLCGRRLAGGPGGRGLGVACALEPQSSDHDGDADVMSVRPTQATPCHTCADRRLSAQITLWSHTMFSRGAALCATPRGLDSARHVLEADNSPKSSLYIHPGALRIDRGFFREGYLLGGVGHEGARESCRARHGVLLELEARTLRPQDACNDLFQLRVGICAELQRSTLCGRRLAGGLG